ncbi:MAG TPA: DUF2130 domain-containing protein [Flavipsychrobacter sp.]|nr:DUF2130 domain-containing protein [Flavipsychrobacter sp.]
MSTLITCPHCNHQFEPNDVLREQLQREMNDQAKKWMQKKDEEFRQREAAYQKQLETKDEENRRQLEEEKKKLTEQVSQHIRRQLLADHEHQLKMMQENMDETRTKLEESRKKELDFLKKEQEILNKEKELDLKLQQALLAERGKLEEQIRQQENERVKLKDQEHELAKAELKKQLEDQKKLIEEMKRKAEQGSMQLQGEVQELALEELLRNNFPFDLINEVGKGKRGADCILTVRNNYGQECGSIIFESKRTKDFGKDWIEKLKADARNHNADVAVIVTTAMPDGMTMFGAKEGVWICTFQEVQSFVTVLRDSIIKVHTINKNNENRGDKMHMLYDYLTSHEFSEQWKAIREGFMSMKISIQRERDAMEKLWKTREKQLEKVLLNAAHIRGSIEGISGMEQVDLNLGGEEDPLLLD